MGICKSCSGTPHGSQVPGQAIWYLQCKYQYSNKKTYYTLDHGIVVVTRGQHRILFGFIYLAMYCVKFRWHCQNFTHEAFYLNIVLRKYTRQNRLDTFISFANQLSLHTDFFHSLYSLLLLFGAMFPACWLKGLGHEMNISVEGYTITLHFLDVC
jgi:hypothetical protein